MAALTTLLAEIGSGHTPWKIACRVVSTSNITLATLQTIDSIALAEGDRVLVAGHTDPKQNGIYLASASTWTRAPDMAKSSYAMLGTTVRIMESGGDNEGWWTMATPINGTIRIGVTEMTFEQLGGFVVPEVVTWTPALITGAFFWAKGISDATLRTMSGANVLTMSNGISNGLIMTATGTPTIDSANLLNGHPSLVLGSTHELSCPSGGPVGNQSHWCVILTDGDATGTSEALARCGARNTSGAASPSTTSSVGILDVAGTKRYNACDPANDFLPYADGSGVPIADGSPRIVGGHHLPTYGQRIVRVDGYVPQPAAAANWTIAETYNLDGTFAFGRHRDAAAASNSSRIRDAVWGTGEISAGDYARLAAYWRERFSLAEIAPRIIILGDSNSKEPPTLGSGTTGWATVMATTLAAQLTIDSRTAVAIQNMSLNGKYAGGTWAFQPANHPGSFLADGQYVTYNNSPTNNQGTHQSAPYSRSGRREYEIAIVMMGTNDIINGGVAGATGDEVIARLQYICTQLKSHGYAIVLSTLIPGSNAANLYDGTKEPYRTTVNSWITTSAIADGYADRVVDHGATALTWNVTYYGAGPDTLHPNDTGYALMAATFYSQVYSLIQELDP